MILDNRFRAVVWYARKDMQGAPNGSAFSVERG